MNAPAASPRRAPQKAKPYLQRLLDRIDAPAIVMTPTHDVLASLASTESGSPQVSAAV